MKKLYLLSTILLMAFVFIYSCSTEEEDTTPPPSVVTTPEPEPEPTQYTLTVTAGEGGSVSTEGGTYDEGTEVTITATANDGYRFVGWEGNDSNEESLTITLNSNETFNALFEAIIQYTLTVTSGEGGTVSTEGGTYDEGTEVTITASPNEGYEFVGWEGSDNDSNSLNVTLNNNTTIQALFERTRLNLIISLIEGPPDKVVTGFTFTGFIPFNENNIFFNPTRFFTYPTYPLLHLKRDSIWRLNRIYDDMHFQVIRDYKKLDENNLVIADQGLEIGQEDRDAVVDLGILDMGETYHLNFENDILTRTTLSQTRGFYHSIDAGNLDGDNKLDVVSMYMALPEGVEDNKQGTMMSMFSESSIGNFNFVDTTNKIQTLDWESTFSGAVLIDDFTGDNQLDLIKFSYKTPTGFEAREDFLYSYELLSYNSVSNKIESLQRKPRFPEYPTNYGIAWARSFDMDNDNDKDLIVFMERGSGVWKMQVWENTSGGNFEFSSEILSTESLGFQSRDFHVYDFDNDGDLDIFLQPFGSIGFPINFSSSIYVNNNGTFEKYREDVIFDQEEGVDMYGLLFMEREGKPFYIGIEEMPDGLLKLYEFELTLD